MRRWLSIAAFSLVLLALPLWAQRGGHGGGGGGGAHFSSGASSAHFASHGGFAGHTSGVHSSGAFHGTSFARSSGIRIRTVNPYRHPRGVYGLRGYPYYSYGYYPWGYYGWDSGVNGDLTSDQDSYASDAPPYPDNNGLQRDVQVLSGKIDRLQADAEARSRKPEQEPMTALVFRDQHVEEVHNYAIAGGTLWVLNDQASKKIPLAQLDLPATVKVNDDRGVDFQLPEPAMSIMIMR